MITYLNGRIRTLNRDPARAVVVCGGVGYEVTLPVFVQQSLTDAGLNVGDEVELEIYYHVTDRQPKPLLVGFRRPDEREFFEQLVQVEGIGPVRAAAALVFPVSVIARAIESEDTSVLTQLPGVGARAAQKMIATLRGKVTATALLRDDGIPESRATAAVTDPRVEAIDVLVGLGYRPVEARDSVRDAINRRPETADEVQELVREVFRGQVALQQEASSQ
jgi:Holliday junction DNA helicase RuvA